MPIGNLTQMTDEERGVDRLLGCAGRKSPMTVAAATATTAFRGRVLQFVADPADAGERAHVFDEDGVLVVRDGRVVACGDWAAIRNSLPAGTAIVDHSGNLILPGFIDTHIHYPQSDIIASYGEQLLEWLDRYTFPTERRFADPAHAREVASFFLDELLRNGTTTASIFATVHPESVDAIFEEARAREMCVVAGKVLMDRNCPEFLRDTAESGYEQSAALIARWHGRDRLLYAVTPRFAPTSTDRQLELAGRLLDEHPGRVDADARCREHGRGALGRRTVSVEPQLSRRLRPLWPASPRRRLRALHPSRSRRPAADGRVRCGHVLLRDVEPLSRQRPVRSGRRA